MKEKTAIAMKSKVLKILNKRFVNGNSPITRVINAAFIRS